MKFYFLLVLAFLSVNSFAKITSISGQSLQNKQDVSYQINEFKKDVVIIFLSKDCPCSKGNLSYINELSKNYPNFKFIGIHAKKDSTIEQLRDYLADKKINFEMINDNDMKMTNAFGALKTPHAFILNQQGEIIYNGGITNTTFPENAKTFYLKNTLNEITNNQPISKSETKTFGCFIVR